MKRYLPVAALLMTHSWLGAQNKSYVLLSPADTEADRITKAANVVPTPRQLRWQQLELTAFFHFGINTFTNREWGNGKEDPALFNPTALDARQWVQAVKDAGIKQVIITAKHHDGFCLWPTATTRHSVASSPWKGGKGDVVKEVAEACKALNIGFGIYLSPWDRNAPIYGTDAYNDFFITQLTELLTRYGKVDEVWFDGANGEGPNGKKQVYAFDRYYAHIRQLQPEAVIAIMGPDVRWVGTESGYGRETEWSVVPADNLNQESIAANSQKDLAFKPTGDMMADDLGSREKLKKAKALVWYPAETDVSIRPGWFYHSSEDTLVKSADKLMDIYLNSVGKNGVLLLNIPPDRRGLLHEADVAALKAWKAKRDAAFGTNLAAAGRITDAGGKPIKGLTDGKLQTAHSIDASSSNNTIVISWKKPVKLSSLMLMENIAQGQRVEGFVVEAHTEKGWVKVAEGTTIGYKRILLLKSISSTTVRIQITSSRLETILAEIGIY